MAKIAPTKRLQQWLVSLNGAHPDGISGTNFNDVLAHAHRAQIKLLLADVAVQEAIDRPLEKTRNGAALSKSLEVIKYMLVDGCWLHRMSWHGQAPPVGSGTTPSTQGKNHDALETAARKANILAKDITSLLPVTGNALTLDHLISRYANGNPSGFIASRKGWGGAIVSTRPSIPDLLEMLAAELKEEADLLKSAMAKSRQTGGSLRGVYPLIDALCRKSLQLGNTDSSGAPCPDFQLVHAVLTSLTPDGRLDESTLRRRWNRQGKPKPKPP